MKPISQIEPKICKNLFAIFSDIDDTITHKGKILPSAFNAMWKLYKSGIKFIPVTGRSAGWVDHFARMWPCHAVIGENGAFYSYMSGKKLVKKYYDKSFDPIKNQRKLDVLLKDINKKYPKAKPSSDQGFREFDLSIDYCEDIKRFTDKEIDEIVKIYKRHGANVKISSIHINGWFGNFDKFSMIKKFLKQEYKLDFTKNKEKFLFIGDSQNDEPNFKAFKYSVGVSNVKAFLKYMKHHPTFITKKPGGYGFSEMVEKILKGK